MTRPGGYVRIKRTMFRGREGRFARSGKRADHHVVTVQIAECELSGSGSGILPGLFLEPTDKGSGARQRLVEVIHTEEQQ
jgi:hypothetical protein